ncbi:hypothetical protein P0D75_42845, partial [Paraburkholderia sediminicola]|uniref:hypothetical protein n=1 Tax=Paraburkholderia sediminicola TaxID=458836 RepID=UPI0038B7E0B2
EAPSRQTDQGKPTAVGAQKQAPHRQPDQANLNAIGKQTKSAAQAKKQQSPPIPRKSQKNTRCTQDP